MSNKNPFSLSFGRVPYEYIPRPQQTQQILDMFNGTPVTDQVYIVEGVRGTGKTVLLNATASELEKDPAWIVLKISSSGNILQTMCSDLYYNEDLRGFSSGKDVNWSVKAGPVEIHTNDRINVPAPSLNFQIDQMLSFAAGKKKKVLVEIDEITASEEMIEFSSALQIFIGNKRPVYFLGSSLYENLEKLRNVKNLTFLYRAPRIRLQPLDETVIAASYRRVLDIDERRADQMAALTKGYSFGYQALGYVYWENRDHIKSLNDLLPEYDYYLSDFSYKKIWSELSEKDRKVASAIADHNGNKVSEIRAACGMDSGLFSVYRNRLKNKGIINVSTYGKISFSLPRFSEFVHQVKKEMI